MVSANALRRSEFVRISLKLESRLKCGRHPPPALRKANRAGTSNTQRADMREQNRLDLRFSVADNEPMSEAATQRCTLWQKPKPMANNVG